ncbi:hypothetical protein BDA96_04G099600 [Sorghum bicolor]|jgi:hypothetical protein|uniref:Uncharacterized protein n=1 Tax=Sorghum bicolor TaxID=4558 RepID=A0A921UHL2_SORBI|nr:hypothetical protein BDA96_04G099600 [Sorghum bicolor]
MTAPQAAMAGQPVNAAAVDERLLVDQEANHHPQPENNGDNSCFPWPTVLGFLILSFNAAMAIIRSQGDVMAIAFVGFAYAILVALFVCLRMYERARAGSSKREWLKIAVWILTTLLTFSFSYKVAAIMPAPMAVVVWLMAFATVAGGFVAFFVYKEK